MGYSQNRRELLAGVNPKNLGLTMAAALTTAQARLAGGQSAIAVAVFVIIAIASVAAPVLYYLVAGESAAKTLDGWKVWLLANHTTVMFILFLVLGAKLVGNGLGGLIS